MPTSCATNDVFGRSDMRRHSQIANTFASGEIRKSADAPQIGLSHYANMSEHSDKNGGPNHLRAWMKHRKINGVKLADLLGDPVTPGMVSDLVNSNRALSAKWLRRIAPLLDTTPGMLLDHDPNDLGADIIEIWATASARERQQLLDLAKVVVSDKTGTDDG